MALIMPAFARRREAPSRQIDAGRVPAPRVPGYESVIAFATILFDRGLSPEAARQSLRCFADP
jgi:hypothetical protein